MSDSAPLRFHEPGMRELRHVHARGLAGVRLELEVDAAMDARAGLLLGQLPESRKVARDRRKSSGPRPCYRESNVVAIEDELKRSCGRRRETGDIPRIGRIRRRRQQWRPSWVRPGGRIEVFGSPPTRRNGTPEPIDELAREGGLQAV